MKTVSQLSSVLSGYLPAVGPSPTTMVGMLNQVLPRLYEQGDYQCLLTEWETDVSSGYFPLPPQYSAIISATLNDVPVVIRSLKYETQHPGTGPLSNGVSETFGFIDKGLFPLMSEIASVGADEFIFTSTAAFASGDVVTVTYNDSVDGYLVTAVPLHAIAPTFSAASDSGDGNTILTVSSSTGLVANMGITITGASTAYNATWRVVSVTDATHIVIDKEWTATTTGTIANAKRLMPPNAISSVIKVEYASLPADTMMKDADGIIYAILPAGDGISQFRRFNCPQVPSETTDEYLATCIVKRAFIPLTSTSDVVYIDNIQALKYGIQAVIYEDQGEFQAATISWGKAKKAMDDQEWDTRGGVQETQSVNPWGTGIAGINGRY
jgi:hypothetical protein